ncbi:MAG TPA: DNA mismatch repair endonuclease MutL [Limnochordia bacterium]
MAIRLLPPDLVNRIAAGEVIERPASVVKELVENAIDAGARRIRIEVEGGGIEAIVVQDDGCGIPADEAPIAFLRHATSKVRSAEDLAAISTLGFRGEALPSIAAVAAVEMRTRPPESDAACRVLASQSRVGPVEVCAGPVGTRVAVRELFTHTPARRKFLKSPVAEKRAISEHVSRIALSRPDIAFTLISDGRQLFHTPGDGSLLSAAAAVWGAAIAGRMISLGPSGGDGLRVKGLLGAPADARATRASETFFVNGRWIESRLLAAAVERAYATRLMSRRFPIVALHVEIDPADVDVNVHPAKAHVRFRDERAVFRAVSAAVEEALAAADLIGRAAQPVSAMREKGIESSDRRLRADPLFEERQPASPTVWIPAAMPLPTAVAEAPPPSAGTVQRPTAPRGALRPGPTPRHWERSRPAPAPPAGSEAERARERLRTARPLGQHAQTYIVAEAGPALWLIDQHAAHERVLYERLLGEEASRAAQPLLAPIPLGLGSEAARALEGCLDDLSALGFEIVPFGPSAFAVRQLPFDVSPAEAEAVLAEVIDDVLALAEREGPTRRERLAAMLACKSAVRAGDRLQPETIRHLLLSLAEAANPFTCPHGRPIVVELGPDEIERRFGRR